MDTNCHYVANPGSMEVCGFAGVAYTPVALIWDDTLNLDEGMTVVPFSIAAESPDSYTLWKGSAGAPLLVYDPDGTGQVISARQLFGQSAFGGKTVDPQDYRKAEIRAGWENGFDALGLMDVNKDGRVSGKELRGLALWFDANRDGTTQQGEIKTLASQKITALYYKWDSRAETGDLAVAIGYERTVAGKKVFGRAVDWFSPTFATKEEALQALASMSNKVTARSETGSSTSAGPLGWPEDAARFKVHPVTDPHEDISGFWIWGLKDESGQQNPGLFAFEQSSKKEVVGYSIAEAVLQENESKLHSFVRALPASGKVKRNEQGKLELSIIVADNEGTKAESTATLSEDGTMLFGKTRQTFSLVKQGTARRSAAVEYEWVASRFMPPDSGS